MDLGTQCLENSPLSTAQSDSSPAQLVPKEPEACILLLLRCLFNYRNDWLEAVGVNTGQEADLFWM